MAGVDFKIAITLEGMKELVDHLARNAHREARNEARRAVSGLAARVRDALRQRVKKRTKALAKSIKVVRRRGKPDFPVAEVRAGAKAPYAIMLEFGTSKTRAQPYIVPTVEEMRAQLPQYYRDEFGAKFEKLLAKKARANGSVEKL